MYTISKKNNCCVDVGRRRIAQTSCAARLVTHAHTARATIVHTLHHQNLAQTSSDTYAVAPAADTIRHNYHSRVSLSRDRGAAIVRTICSTGEGGNAFSQA